MTDEKTGDFSPDLKVLIVDDFANMRRIIKEILGKLGIKNVKEAENGQKAIATMENEKFDLVLMDWNMPVMGGLPAIKRIKSNENLKDVPIILVTSEAVKENIIAAAKAGVSEYVIKPFSAETIGEKIKRALNIKEAA